MYHYDPFGHALEPVPAPAHLTAQLVQRATAATGGSPPPQVLLVLTARFGRVMWRYQGMAYALILKDVGALMQTMYLVATAMNLAPCALGAGDSDLFAQATNLNPLVEASVGEFTLSSRAP
jgi:SagB-type dehydrogenase family enzyme